MWAKCGQKLSPAPDGCGAFALSPECQQGGRVQSSISDTPVTFCNRVWYAGYINREAQGKPGKSRKAPQWTSRQSSTAPTKPSKSPPVALQDIPGYSDYSALAIFDAKTGSPLYQDYSYDWRLLPAEEGYDTEDAETIHDIYGEDEDSWETAANKGLEDYGLKLGKFVDTFDFEVAGRRYDGYMLEEI